jgi:hypothetical protein
MLLYGLHRPKMDLQYSLASTLKRALTVFFLPGGLAAGLFDAIVSDDRVRIRTLIDMLFWNVVIVVRAAVAFR